MAKVTVLMSTYNGEHYLREQIDCILAQKNVEIALLVRDDGSTDSTTQILDEYKSAGKLDWYTGLNLRPAQSFMDLVYNAPESDYYAFADQDDYWYEDKMAAGVERLSEVTGPAAYYCRKRVTDEGLNTLGAGEDMYRPNQTLGFTLIKCTVAGCAMMFNKALCEKLKGYKPQKVVMHDVWVLLVALATGRVIDDERIFMDYRQHGHNFWGSEQSAAKRLLNRIKAVPRHLKNRERSEQARELLNGFAEQMEQKDRKMIENMLSRNIFLRMRAAISGYFRHESAASTLLVRLLIVLGWI